MTFLIVDDEPLALESLTEAVCAAAPGCLPAAFPSPRAALEYARSNPIDTAFLDIELGSMSGLALALALKKLQPDLHIIFVTSYDHYAVDAFAIHATGYLLKPVAEADIRRELTFIYGEATVRQRVRVQTFGGFDVFVDGRPLSFGRAKAKELLALLVDRRGNSITTREACAVLWEDEPYTTTRKNYFQAVVSDLRTTLRSAGAGGILVKSHNALSIDPTQLDCDSYRFFDGDPQAVNSYRGDYMRNYSWAEFRMGEFDRMLWK